jgi:hypothetical protein
VNPDLCDSIPTALRPPFQAALACATKADAIYLLAATREPLPDSLAADLSGLHHRLALAERLVRPHFPAFARARGTALFEFAGRRFGCAHEAALWAAGAILSEFQTVLPPHVVWVRVTDDLAEYRTHYDAVVGQLAPEQWKLYRAELLRRLLWVRDADTSVLKTAMYQEAVAGEPADGAAVPVDDLQSQFAGLRDTAQREYAATGGVWLAAVPAGVRLQRCDEHDPNCGTISGGEVALPFGSIQNLGTVSMAADAAFQVAALTVGAHPADEMQRFVDFAGKAGALLAAHPPAWVAPVAAAPDNPAVAWAAALFFLAPAAAGSVKKMPGGGRLIRQPWGTSLAALREWQKRQQADNSDAKGARPAKGRKNINARMLESIQANPETLGWNSVQWAMHLKCSKSSVVETTTWKDLAMRRDRGRAERAKDRRRKSKASDRRRE